MTRKLVELVKATCFDVKIFVVDETTTALSQSGRENLYKQMKRIRDEGNTVVFISHDLQEVLDKTDTISVFRDGQYIDTVESREMTEDDLKRLMVGRELDKKYFRSDFGRFGDGRDGSDRGTCDCARIVGGCVADFEERGNPGYWRSE